MPSSADPHPPGHLFIVRADITSIACDGWLVPGDEDGPGQSWRARYAFGPQDPPGEELKVRRAVRWTAAPGDARVPWLVHLGGDEAHPIEWYLEGVAAFLARATQDPTRATKRHVPLYALPLVGTGGGGAKTRSGELTAMLVPALVELARTFEVDLALCLWTKAQYAAAQEARSRAAAQDPRVWAALGDRLLPDAARVGEEAQGRLVLFLGGGVSQNAGLPSWDGLLDGLARDLGIPDDQIKDLAEIRDPLARAEAIRAVAGADEAALKRAIAERIERHAHPSLCHCILASLPVEEAITTNYDRLFERAWTPHRTELRVLPYQSVAHGKPWLLKLHGTTVRPGPTAGEQAAPRGDDIVVTRTDYAQFDLRWRALASIVETLLVTRHMLFVGFSLADPNFQRMVDTVSRAVRAGETGLSSDEHTGTILEVNPTPYLAQVWGGEFHVVSMATARGDDILRQARLLEVFLDRVAADAYPRSAYLLDPTAVGLLDDDEHALQQHLLTFVDALERDPRFAGALGRPDVARRSPALAHIRELLATLGWRGARKPTKPDPEGT